MGEIIKKDDLKSNIQSVWGTSDGDQLENIANEVTKSVKKTNLKHGLFANIPLICRGNLCPYKSACYVENKPQGERCPIEIGAILSRFESHCQHFGIRFSEKGEVFVEDVVDASMVRDLVDIEIQMLRADNKLALDGDFIGQTVSAVSDTGQVYYDDVVSPAAEFKMTLLKQKNKLLEKLNATRKDKSDAFKDDHTANSSKHLLEKITELASKNGGGNLDFEDVDLDAVELDDDSLLEEITQETVEKKDLKGENGVLEEEPIEEETEEFDEFDEFDDIKI